MKLGGRPIIKGNRIGEIYEDSEATLSDLRAENERLRHALSEILKMNNTLGIDDHYLFPEIQEAIKILNNDNK